MSKHNEHTAKLIEERLRRDFPNLEIHTSYWKDNLYILNYGENVPPHEKREVVAQKLRDYVYEIDNTHESVIKKHCEEVKETPKHPRKVRIQNDGGLGCTTRLTDADTGESIDRIYHVRVVDIDAKDLTPRAILWSYAPAMDIVANAEIVEACPHCGAQKYDLKKLDDDRIKTTINDTDLDLSIDKLKQIQDLQRSTRGNNIYPAEALAAFTEWVRERWGDYLPDSFRDLITMFCEAQGWRFDQEYYDEVIKQVRANYPG